MSKNGQRTLRILPRSIDATHSRSAHLQGCPRASRPCPGAEKQAWHKARLVSYEMTAGRTQPAAATHSVRNKTRRTYPLDLERLVLDRRSVGLCFLPLTFLARRARNAFCVCHLRVTLSLVVVCSLCASVRVEHELSRVRPGPLAAKKVLVVGTAHSHV